MHVAIISHQVGLNDGQGRVNYEIVLAALDAGMHLTLLAESCAPSLAAHDRVRLVLLPTSPLPTRFLKSLSFALRSAFWLKRNRHGIDVMQATGFITFVAVDVVAAHYVHGAWLRSPYAALPFKRWRPGTLYQRFYTWANSWLEQTAFQRARRVVAVSENVARELRCVGVSDSRIQVIFNGVDTREFHPRPSDRALFSLPAGVPLFLFAGDIRTPRKNLDNVLRAIAQVPGVHLAVAGDIDQSPYPALARELGIAERVHFLGRTARMSDLMAAVDALLFPSRYDPLGLVVLEAMATGLPVVTANTAGAAALLNDPKWTLTDPEDLPELIRLVRRLADDPQLRKTVGEANRAKALSCSWTQMANQYLALYTLIAAQNSAVAHASPRLGRPLPRLSGVHSVGPDPNPLNKLNKLSKLNKKNHA